MGKKKGAHRALLKKRAEEAQLELVEADAHHVATSHITSKSNDQLFVLDTTAEHVPKQELPKRQHKKKPKHSVTKIKVGALLKKHDAATLQLMAAQTSKKKRKSTAAFDLWQDEDKDEEPQTRPTKSVGGIPPEPTWTKAAPAPPLKRQTPTVAVDVAQCGQSYHPDVQQHQNVIGEALALELRRNEALDYKQAPLATGLNDETKAFMLQEEFSSSEDEDDDKEPPVFHKQKSKLTRAQHNRQKRVRAQQKQERSQKLAKKRMNAIAEAKKVTKDLAKQDQAQKERREQIKALQQSSKRTLGKLVVQHLSESNPIRAPTLPVALTDELSGSLRTIKPKGSLVTDRMESFKDRNMTHSKKLTRKTIVQGNKRRKLKVRGKSSMEVSDEMGQDYLLMG